MEVIEIINNKKVVFEQGELIDRHGHSRVWSMEGHTKINGKWVHTHNATGSFTYTDDFEELTDIEEV